jgi:hypothetical protein
MKTIVSPSPKYGLTNRSFARVISRGARVDIMDRKAILPVCIGAAVLLTAFSIGEEVEPRRAAYVGAKKCKVCHVGIFETWAETRHAKALSVLEGEEARDARCLECHTTGFGTGGYAAEGNVLDLGGIQCEACHGPGSLYSFSSIMMKPELSAKAGLVAVDSLTCVRCHNAKSPTFKGFAYEAGLLTGTHSRKRD